MTDCEHARVENHACLDCGAVFVFCQPCSVFNGQDCYHLPPVCVEDTVDRQAVDLTRSILK